MTKNITIAFMIMAAAASAQSLRWQTFQQSISANDADTTWFAFRPGFQASDIDPDSVAIVPPENTVIDEDALVTIRLVSGTASDSLISYAKPIISVDGTARVVYNDSLFLFGSAFAAPASPNSFGNGNLHAKPLTSFATKRMNGVMIVTKFFDLVGGARRFEFGLGTK